LGRKVLMLQLEMTLAAVPTAPGAARQAVHTWFHSRHCRDDPTNAAALLVTELVSNAVVHANCPSLWLTVDETRTDVLHVAVRDGSEVVEGGKVEACRSARRSRWRRGWLAPPDPGVGGIVGDAVRSMTRTGADGKDIRGWGIRQDGDVFFAEQTPRF
jgi:hypothetical protein